MLVKEEQSVKIQRQDKESFYGGTHLLINDCKDQYKREDRL